MNINDEMMHRIEKIEKMLELLLNEEQKEEIKQFDIDYLTELKIQAENKLLRSANNLC